MKKSSLFKVSKKIVYFAFFLTLVALTFFYIAKLLDEQVAVSKDYSELVMLGKDKENNYVNLEINYLPYYIVKRNNSNITLKYYIVVDKNNYMYIVRLTDETYLKMKDLYQKDPDNFSYYIEGYIFKTPEDLKQNTIESYNNLAEQEIVNDNNFSSYFGKSYLDETNIPYLNSNVFLIVAAIILIILSILLIIYYIILVIKNKKMLAKYDLVKLEKEINSKRTIYFKKLNLYLTNKYIIVKHYTLKIISYNDIIWAYNEKNYYNGILTNYSLVSYLKNNHKINMATSNNKEDLIKIIKKISKKNNNALIGYSKENKKKFNKYKKTVKS